MCNSMKAKFLLSVCAAGEKSLPGIIKITEMSDGEKVEDK